jgi:hypothetical protein
MLTCTVKGLKLGAQRGEKRKQTVCGAVGRRELIPVRIIHEISGFINFGGALPTGNN